MSSFWQKMCKCGRKNHFAAVCRTQDAKSKKSYKKVHEVDVEDGEDDISDDPAGQNYVIESLEQSRNYEIKVAASFEGNNFKLKIDLGAKCNVISLNTLKKFKVNDKIKNKASESVSLKAYGGQEIPKLGLCQLKLKKSTMETKNKF